MELSAILRLTVNQLKHGHKTVEKISNTIDSLIHLKKKSYFSTSILSESINLQFDSEGKFHLLQIIKTY